MLRSPTLTLGSLLFGGGTQAHQQDVADFQCGNFDAVQQRINVLDTKNFLFDSVAPGIVVDECGENEFLAPFVTHWHIFSIPAGEPPSISTSPGGLVEPFICSNILQFHLHENAMDGFAETDTIKAGVNIFLPPDLMKKVIIEGIAEHVEIVNNLTSSEFESMEVECLGTVNTVYVSSPNTRVDFKGSGFDNTAIIEAASGSSIEFSGTYHRVQIKTSGDDLNVIMSGEYQELTIEGAYNHIESSGIDNQVYINGPNHCNNIHNSGTSMSCSVTQETVTVPKLPCLSPSSKVQLDWWPCPRWSPPPANSTTLLLYGDEGLLIILMLLCCLSSCYVRRSERCCGGDCNCEESEFFPPPVELLNDDERSSLKNKEEEQQNDGHRVVRGEGMFLEVEVFSDTTTTTTSVDDQDQHSQNQV